MCLDISRSNAASILSSIECLADSHSRHVPARPAILRLGGIVTCELSLAVVRWGCPIVRKEPEGERACRTEGEGGKSGEKAPNMH